MATATRKDDGRKEKAKGGADEEKTKAREERCRHCWRVVTSKQDGIQCEICCIWVHCKCAEIPEEAYNVVENQGIHYFCKWCDETANSMISMMTKLNDRQNKLESQLLEIEATQYDKDKHVQDIETDVKGVKTNVEVAMKAITELRERVEKVEKKIEDDVYVKGAETNVEEAMKAVIERVEKVEKRIEDDEQIPQNITGVKEVLQDFKKNMDEEREEARKMLVETKERIQNEKDREARKNNIIIYRVEENASASADDRANYDRQWAKDLTREVLKVYCQEEDIKRVIRLGARGSTDRPMLVEYRSHIIKNQVMESLSMLKGADERYCNISIQHDMTKREREQCKETVKLALEQKAADQSGEYKYLVKGYPGSMRVVKIRNRK